MAFGTGSILAVVRLLVAPNLSKLLELARAFAAGEGHGHHMKVQELEEELEFIEGIVVDAAGSGSGSAGAVDELQWLLGDAIHDAEDLLGVLRCKRAGANHHALNKCGLVVAAVAANASLNRMRRLVDGDLPDLLRSVQELRTAAAAQRGGVSRPATDPRPANGKKLFGYTEEYTALLSSLAPDAPADCGGGGGGDARVVAVVGRGGTGKTELARRVFSHDDDKVGASFEFDLRIWACVYGKFTEADLLSAIWTSVPGADDAAGDMSVSHIQHELTEKVRAAKRFLLVLDDVCNDESAASELSKKKTWDRVLAPFLQHGGGGGRILLTTRAQMCAETLNAGVTVVLNGIGTDAMMLLLKNTAFGDEHADVPGDVQDVLQSNVGRLHGSPLAAEQVVSSLTDKNNNASWRQSLKKGDEYHKTHLSSYHDLAPHLRRCLAFCSMFPRRWEFEPEKLAEMWMAHSFVAVPLGPGRIAREEDTAMEYFDALLRRSLFQESGKGKGRYVIHEEIHSMLLRHAAPRYYLRIDGPFEAEKIPATVRHLAVSVDCVHQLRACRPAWLKKLRTLLVYTKAKDDDYASSTSEASIGGAIIDWEVLKEFKGVRVLDLSGTAITELPETMSELRNVRYLGLPSTIQELVPRGVMSRMINLRYLHTDAQIVAGGIRGLEKLQRLTEFNANATRGRRVSELRHLNSLRGTLSVKGLEAVRSKRQARRARLSAKKHLEVLKLEWGHRHADEQLSGLDLGVLDGLQPHPNLQELHVAGYQGRAWPAWLADGRALHNLRSLYLRNCGQLQELPHVGELPRLEVLSVEGMRSVVSIDSSKLCGNGASSFRSLNTVVLKGMENLVAWDDADEADDPAGDGDGGGGGGGGEGTPILFGQLRKVEIIDCPKLRSFSGLLRCRTSLTDLRVEGCREVAAAFTRRNFPLLTQKNLHIHECPGLKNFMD
ncbi:hypothetical protein ACP4OV_010365 [Aristida adscensionis]